ncbi:HEAT repeat domain-containing protein [Actinosynnema pretiosum]|uniref:HEAT repeat domain-containing protein n=1 Tax=Actinosynnema pretiosum TaxID=42197 RepID=A0A290Z9A7_9PSEU|nr:hypothetical protein [Actinosynnema pretiosum]ATE55563.1 hypothetical protein CNX65_21605 [Actinosynnema pretiosum]
MGPYRSRPPRRWPSSPADLASPLLALYDADARPEPPAGFSTGTLVGALREGGFPHRADLVRDLSAALDDRVAERTGLLTSLLRSPRRGRVRTRWGPRRCWCPVGAVTTASWSRWSGTGWMTPRRPHGRRRSWKHWGELVAPAADALARALEAEPLGEPSLGPVLRALGGLRDERALPALRRALERPEPPGGIGGLIGACGSVAADLVPLLRARLRDPRPLWAAGALWRVTADAGPVLPVLLRHLTGADQHRVREAAEALAELGPVARSARPALREVLRGKGTAWVELHAARALWRVAGEAHVDVLCRVWAGNRHARTDVARCFAELGPRAASAGPLLREESGQARRHTAMPNAWSSDQVPRDLALLRACDAALTAMG